MTLFSSGIGRTWARWWTSAASRSTQSRSSRDHPRPSTDEEDPEFGEPMGQASLPVQCSSALSSSGQAETPVPPVPVRILGAIAALTMLCGLLVTPSVSAQAQEDWIAVSTPRFRVEAAIAHTAQASWYAAFVEQVHDELSDLLSVSLDRTIRVRLY